MKVVSASQMRNLDQRAINEFGIPSIILMENAGRAAVDVIEKYFPKTKLKRVGIFAGAGNNGGDGLVIGRHLINRGVEVIAFLLNPKEKIKGDARINLELYEKLGPIDEVQSKEELFKFHSKIARCDLIVDAIFGTGLTSEIKGFYREVIEYINSLPIPVLSVDIPSGVDATTGKILGVAVQADFTVTFGLPKIGLVIYPGLNYVGILEVADISIPRYLVEEENISVELLEVEDIVSLLRPRDPNSHKGSYGHLLVIAGSVGKTGAAFMTSEAALKIGAGLVTLGIPTSLNPILEIKLTEVMTEPLPETPAQTLSLNSIPRIEELMEGKKALALGPGISTHPETISVVHHLIQTSSIPLIIDADGINAVAKNPAILKKAKSPLLLTPHPGEMARLIQTSVKEVQEDRIGVAKRFAQENGVVLVLKGARTVIAEPKGNIYINPTGNPNLASGGTGDVLTGMIAGLVSQGYSLSEASRLGVFLHGYIADELKEELGEIGMVATDIITRIPLTLKKLLFEYGGFS